MSAVVAMFQARNPGLKIRPLETSGTRRRTAKTAKRDANGAVPDDACNCTIARSVRRLDGVADAAIKLSTAYLLEDCGGGYYEVTKYELSANARLLIDLNDRGEACPWNTELTLRPPSSQRKPRVQTTRQKASQPKAHTQTAAHVRKRVAARKRSAGRRLWTSVDVAR